MSQGDHEFKFHGVQDLNRKGLEEPTRNKQSFGQQYTVKSFHL
jgi:hypothetical protein